MLLRAGIVIILNLSHRFNCNTDPCVFIDPPVACDTVLDAFHVCVCVCLNVHVCVSDMLYPSADILAGYAGDLSSGGQPMK